MAVTAMLSTASASMAALNKSIPLPTTDWPATSCALFNPLPKPTTFRFCCSFKSVLGTQVEEDRHATNLFAVLVGASSKARKGTSAGRVRLIMQGMDAEWTQHRTHMSS